MHFSGSAQLVPKSHWSYLFHKEVKSCGSVRPVLNFVLNSPTVFSVFTSVVFVKISRGTAPSYTWAESLCLRRTRRAFFLSTYDYAVGIIIPG
jgi:hypothetical protein